MTTSRRKHYILTRETLKPSCMETMTLRGWRAAREAAVALSGTGNGIVYIRDAKTQRIVWGPWSRGYGKRANDQS